MIAQVIQRFENAKAGDKVWSCIHGIGEVVWIKGSTRCPVEVSFAPGKSDDMLGYTACGRYRTRDIYPELYHSEKEFINERMEIHGHLMEINNYYASKKRAVEEGISTEPGAINTVDIPESEVREACERAADMEIARAMVAGKHEKDIVERDMRINLLEGANRIECEERKRLERAIVYMAKQNAGEGL